MPQRGTNTLRTSKTVSRKIRVSETAIESKRRFDNCGIQLAPDRPRLTLTVSTPPARHLKRYYRVGRAGWLEERERTRYSIYMWGSANRNETLPLQSAQIAMGGRRRNRSLFNGPRRLTLPLIRTPNNAPASNRSSYSREGGRILCGVRVQQN
jgi:hypothetical protein